MDFYAECEKRKQGRLEKIGELSYRRYQAAKAIEDNQRVIDDLDLAIAAHEEAVNEIDRAQRNFNSYLAVKEGALTTDQLAEAIKAGAEQEADESAPPGAGAD